MKAQAVIIDALFLLLVCSTAAAMLLWASSNYGNKSFKAYSFMYMGEYNNGLLNSLGELEYYDDPPIPGVRHFWIDEVGAYMAGEFDETSPRFTSLTKQWHTICLQSPHPIQLVVFTTDSTAALGTSDAPVYFNCPISSLEPGGENISQWVREFQEWKCPPDGLGGQIPCGDAFEASDGVMYGCDDGGEDTGKPKPCRAPPPYYSSGMHTKICGRLDCIMEAKIYY